MPTTTTTALGSGAAPSSKPRLITRLTSLDKTDQVIEEYNRTAGEYDEFFKPHFYRAPKLAAEGVLRMFPEDGPMPRAQVKVMDIAAGTGLVAQYLYDAGMRDMDALEPSENMIKVARDRGIYNRIIKDTVGDHRIDVEDDTYDVVVVAGGFVPGHIPVSAVDEMVRICKPGGYVINAMRLEFIVTCNEYHYLLSHMGKLEQDGAWRCVHRDILSGYYEDKPGVNFTYQKL